LLLASLLLAACGSVAGPIRKFTKGDEQAYYDFSQPNTFEEGSYGEGVARLQVRDGTYQINVTEGASEIWYGQWGDTFSNVVVDVEAKQITEAENTVYGVMCRMRGRVGQTVSEEATPDVGAQGLAPLPNGATDKKAALDEIARWERFALKRWGRPNGRPFEVRALPDDVAFEISVGLLAADSEESARAVFQSAREMVQIGE
jgi:hypothetical protein